VAELEEKVKDAEAKSQQTNVVIETQIRERTKRVVEKREIIVQKIKEVEKVIDAKCELDPNVVSILNEAAKKP
jgi:acetyl-CoA carboxylase alpha subunit